MTRTQKLLIALILTGPATLLVSHVLIPCYIHERDRAQGHYCTSNLKEIELAKDNAARALKLSDTDLVTEAQITPWLSHGRLPKCPSGGTYSINAMDKIATCSLGDPKATDERLSWHHFGPGE